MKINIQIFNLKKVGNMRNLFIIAGSHSYAQNELYNTFIMPLLDIICECLSKDASDGPLAPSSTLSSVIWNLVILHYSKLMKLYLFLQQENSKATK